MLTMAKIVSVHSFRGGTGKSNLTANLAANVALSGRRVAIVDADIQSPGIHALFGLEADQMGRCLNDYLWERCRVEEAAYDVTSALASETNGGGIYLVPSSLRSADIARVLREGYDVGRLNEGFQGLVDNLRLDHLFIDTHPGLNEETLLSIAVSDLLILILRPDRQDYQGTAVTVEVARKLEVPNLMLVVNKVLPSAEIASLRQQVESAYQATVAAILPLSEELVRMASADLLSLRQPGHAWSRDVQEVARRIVESAALTKS
jgi:MinD-like ATPase involved in chromosome partitioning or flagellar assembly